MSCEVSPAWPVRAELVLNEVARVALLRLLVAKEAGRDAG
jgi:hypothetical protein